MHFLASARYEVTVMLQNSKFVNTKAYNKANEERKYPALSRINLNTSRSRQYDPAAYQGDRNKSEIEQSAQCVEDPTLVTEADLAALEQVQSNHAAETRQAFPRHASVNLEALQAKEDLAMQEEDWRTFFMGKAATKPAALMVTEDPSLLVTGFAEVETALSSAPITTPPPAQIESYVEAYVEQIRTNIFEEPASSTENVALISISELPADTPPAVEPVFVPVLSAVSVAEPIAVASPDAVQPAAPVCVESQPESVKMESINEFVVKAEGEHTPLESCSLETLQAPKEVPPISMEHAMAYMSEEISWTVAAHEAAKEIERLRLLDEQKSKSTLELPKLSSDDSEFAQKCADALAEVERKAWGYTASDKLKEATETKKDELSKPAETEKTVEIKKQLNPAELDKTVEIAKPKIESAEVQNTEAKGAKAEIKSPDDKFCLDDIFNDMISDDQIFRRTCRS